MLAAGQLDGTARERLSRFGMELARERRTWR
jgi:hypothetical protein